MIVASITSDRRLDIMSVTTRKFGVLESGQEVTLYRITNASGAYVSIIDYGATIVELCVPDRNGKLVDVLLGCDDVHAYEHTSGYLGALIGRYGNRIGKGRFTLGGKTIQLELNDGNNHLHGGFKGFNFFMWNAQIVDGGVCFSRVSPDGEGNYPGNLSVKCTYTFSDECALKLHYEAQTDKLTACNLTNHSYFNLNGHNSGTVINHKVQILADKFTAVDAESIPTGELRPVEGTCFDFRKPVDIAEALKCDCEQLRNTGGIDHNFVLSSEQGIRKIASISGPETGIVMDVYTDQPGVQFYIGNFLDGSMPVKGGGGEGYKAREGLCLETQYYPDSVNHPEWPQPFLNPGDKYDTSTIYKFSAR